LLRQLADTIAAIIFAILMSFIDAADAVAIDAVTPLRRWLSCHASLLPLLRRHSPPPSGGRFQPLILRR
jgi:hypothetical protein